jgi:hypothetical protein
MDISSNDRSAREVMATKRSRRDDDDSDADDDRPRRRSREDDDDEDEDDRPRSRRRRDEDDDDDRPRRRRRDDDDEDERPRRRPRRRSRGPSTGKVLGIIGGVVAVVGVIVLVVLLATGSLGGSNISYAKFKAIGPGATLESLEKDFGKPKKLERSEWSKVYYAKDADDPGVARPGQRGPDATLADLEPSGSRIDAWYHWHSGSEDIYVAAGTNYAGKPGLVMKVYTNSNSLRENTRAGGDMSKMVPSFEVQPVR